MGDVTLAVSLLLAEFPQLPLSDIICSWLPMGPMMIAEEHLVRYPRKSKKSKRWRKRGDGLLSRQVARDGGIERELVSCRIDCKALLFEVANIHKFLQQPKSLGSAKTQHGVTQLEVCHI